MAGIEEVRRKADTPKGYFPVGIFLGHMVNNYMTVIFFKMVSYFRKFSRRNYELTIIG